MTVTTWTGAGGTNGAAVTKANSNGASGTAFADVPLAGAGTAKYSNTNTLFTGHMWVRLQAAAGGSDRARCYHAYAATNVRSERFAFRSRLDPNAANIIFAFIDNSGSFAQAGGLRYTTVSGVRHLQLFDRAGGLKKDFGTVTWGSAATDADYADINIEKGTTTSNGSLECYIYDNTGALIDSFSGIGNTNTGTVQYIRSQWGGNPGVLQDLEVGVVKGDDAQAALLGLPTMANVPPVATITVPSTPVEPGVVTFTGTITDSDGSIASATAVVIAGPDVPAVNLSTTVVSPGSWTVSGSFLADESADYTVRLSAVDNAGAASNNSDGDIHTYAKTVDVKPRAILSATSWTATGAATVLDATSDHDPDTYGESPALSSPSELRTRWKAVRPGAGVPVVLKQTLLRDPPTGLPVSGIPYLYANDNTTLLETGATFSVPTTATAIEYRFTGDAVTSAAARDGLVTRVVFTQ